MSGQCTVNSGGNAIITATHGIRPTFSLVPDAQWQWNETQGYYEPYFPNKKTNELSLGDKVYLGNKQNNNITWAIII